MAAAESGRLCIIQAAAVDDLRLGPAAFRMLAALGTYGNRLGYCWPTQGRLAARAGVSRQSVNRHMGELEVLGYIQIIRDEAEKAEALRASGRPGMEVSGCVYRILLDAMPQEPEPESGEALTASNDVPPVVSENPDTPLFDYDSGVQRSASPPNGCSAALQGVQRSASGGEAPALQGVQRLDVTPLNDPLNVPLNQRALGRDESKSQKLPDDEGDWSREAREASDRLQAIGFTALEAINLVRRRGPGQVAVAFDNLAWKEERGVVPDRKGYVVKCITEGWARKAAPSKLAKRLAEADKRSDAIKTASAERTAQIDAELNRLKGERAALWSFIDGLTDEHFAEIADRVIAEHPYLRPSNNVAWRRSLGLCVAIKRTASATELPVSIGV